MKISVKDPETDRILELEAKAIDNDKGPGWSVVMPGGECIVICLKEGVWQAHENQDIPPVVVNLLGEAIVHHKQKLEQTWADPKNPENVADDRRTEQILRQKKEAEIRKENLREDTED